MFTISDSSPGFFPDRSWLVHALSSALACDPALKDGQIDVRSVEGIVWLEGWVADASMAEKALQIATDIAGISVRSCIHVKPGSTEPRSRSA